MVEHRLDRFCLPKRTESLAHKVPRAEPRPSRYARDGHADFQTGSGVRPTVFDISDASLTEAGGLSFRSTIGQQDLTTRKPPKLLVYTRNSGGFDGARDQIRTGDPHVGKEMPGLISLRNFA